MAVYPAIRKTATTTTVDKSDANGKHSVQKETKSQTKSIAVAYFCWLVGGVFGLHHFYLGRDLQAFVWWSTFGGFCGIGLLHDIVAIPGYVRTANIDPVDQFYELKNKMRFFKQPEFSCGRFMGMFSYAYFLCGLYFNAIPQTPVFGFDLQPLHWFIPALITFAVLLIGNIGTETGPWLKTFVVTMLSYQIRWFVADSEVWMPVTITMAAFVYETCLKQWKIPDIGPNRKPKRLYKRILNLLTLTFVYLLLWSTYLYVSGPGNIDERLSTIFQDSSSGYTFSADTWYQDVKQAVNEIYLFVRHHSWSELWKELIDLSDFQSESNAYRTLGLSPMASQSEIKSRWKQLSLENHPDKIKTSDEQERRQAQERFMEIQTAYETISNAKNKRARRNKTFKEV